MSDPEWPGGSRHDHDDPYERGKPDAAFFGRILLAGFGIVLIGFIVVIWAWGHRNPY